MRNLIQKIAGVALVGMLAVALTSIKANKVWADDPAVLGVSSTAVVDVMVTPIVTVDLTASPTYYNFGYLNINTSSVSANINLSNTGNVGVNMQKRGHNSASGNWTINTSSGLNQFRLYAATATAHPGAIGVFSDANDQLSTSLSNLRGVGGASQVSMNPGQAVSIWFRIDMPTGTTVGTQQSIPVNFVGTAQ